MDPRDAPAEHGLRRAQDPPRARDSRRPARLQLRSSPLEQALRHYGHVRDGDLGGAACEPDRAARRHRCVRLRGRAPPSHRLTQRAGIRPRAGAVLRPILHRHRRPEEQALRSRGQLRGGDGRRAGGDGVQGRWSPCAVRRRLDPPREHRLGWNPRIVRQSDQARTNPRGENWGQVATRGTSRNRDPLGGRERETPSWKTAWGGRSPFAARGERGLVVDLGEGRLATGFAKVGENRHGRRSRDGACACVLAERTHCVRCGGLQSNPASGAGPRVDWVVGRDPRGSRLHLRQLGEGVCG